MITQNEINNQVNKVSNYLITVNKPVTLRNVLLFSLHKYKFNLTPYYENIKIKN